MNAIQKKTAALIDQTLLSASVTEDELAEFCRKSAKYGFASVCVNMVHVRAAHEILQKSKTKVCTVVDFPLGAGGLAVKKYGVSAAIASGADEVDVVIDLSLAKAGRFRSLRTQLAHVMRTARRSEAHRTDAEGRPPVVVKAILETCCLTDEEIVEVCKACVRVGVDFVKTSTGFGKGGATVHAVGLMASTVGEGTGVKASGGIRTAAQLEQMVAAGATRIGTSNGFEIVDSLA